MSEARDGAASSPAGPGLDARAFVYVVLMVLIGSSTAPAARYAMRELPVGLVPLVRFVVAGLLLLPVSARCGGNLPRLFREDGLRLLAAAFCCVPLNQAFFLNATRLTATSHVGLIYAAVPLVVLVLAAAVGQERPRIDQLLGVVASVLGVVVIGIDGLWGRSTSNVSASAMVQGDLLLIGAVVAWGAYMTVSKPLIVRHGAITALAATFLLGALLHVPIALATLPTWPAFESVSPAAWWGLVYLTLVATVFALAFQNLAMHYLDASQVATFGNAAPLLTVLWGVWLFGERVTPALAVGGILTLGGIFWTGRAACGRARPSPESARRPARPAARGVPVGPGLSGE